MTDEKDLVELALSVKEASDALEEAEPVFSLILTVLAVVLVELDDIKDRLEVQ